MSTLSSSSPSPLGIAIIGGGIFVRDCHAPTLYSIFSASPDRISIRAVYSRSESSAKATQKYFSDQGIRGVDIYFDCADQSSDNLSVSPPPSSSSSSLLSSYQDLLSRSDIDALIIALPIPDQPAFIRAALSAGKHLLTEKPVAPSIDDAKLLIEHYNKINKENQLNNKKQVLWGIAENWRFDAPLIRMASIIKDGIIGRPMICSLIAERTANPSNKYLKTLWRAEPKYKGGFLLDGGVHFIAALRYVAGDSATSFLVEESKTEDNNNNNNTDSSNNTIDVAGGRCLHLASFQAGPDTLVSSGTLSNGSLYTVSLSFGLPPSSGTRFELSIVGEKGRIKLEADFSVIPSRWTLQGPKGLKEELFGGKGVEEEWRVFLESIEKGVLDDRLRPEEGLADVVMIEKAIEHYYANQEGKK